MGGTFWLTRRHVRRRWAGALPFAAVLAAGLTGALVAANAAYRTDVAWGRYVERAEIGDLLVNPSIQTAQIDAAIRKLPGVTGVVTDDLFYAAIGRYDSTDEALQDPASYVRVTGSTDGRYATRDRVTYRAGRAPTGSNEAMVSREAAEALGIELGDELPITFASIQDDIRAIYLGEEPSIGVIGVETPTVVGIATFPDEVLPDGLYERGRVVVSADIATRYGCTPDEPPPDATLADVIGALAPAACATSYRYWSLHARDAGDGLRATTDALTQALAERTAALPPVMAEQGLGYVPIVTTTADTTASVERTMGPTVVALVAVALAAAMATLVIASLVLARSLRRDDDFHARCHELGVSRRQRAVTVGTPPVVAAAVGVLVAAVIAARIPTGAVGAVGVLERARPGLDGWSRPLGLLLAAAAIGCAVVLSVWVSAIPDHAPTRATRVSRFGRVPAGLSPDVAIGWREALTWERASALTLVSSIVAFAALTATMVFAGSLGHLLESPAAYGWPWDLANLTGSGYGGTTGETVAESLDGEPRIAGWTTLGLTQGVTVDGAPEAAVILYDSPSDSELVTTSGRLPHSADEVALGASSAAERSVGVGDEVELAGEGLRFTRAVVTGIVVLPSLGPYQADAASPGRGVLLPDDAFQTAAVAELVSFVGIDVSDGTDARELGADLSPVFRSWEFYDQPRTLVAPVRPPEIVNAESIRGVPLLVGVLVAVATAIGYVAAMFFSARGRRRELAILRTLGFDNRQLRRSLRVQSVVAAMVACGVGSVIGLVVGRWAWRAFADDLGVVPEPTTSAAAIVAIVAASALLGVCAAVLPGVTARRMNPGETLRAV